MTKRDKPGHDDAGVPINIRGADRVIAEAMESLEKKTAGDVEIEVDPGNPDAKFDALGSLLKQKDERIKEAHERLQRLAADFDNYKKRARKEVEEAASRGQETFIQELLPILDSLERTLEHAQTATDLKGIIEGIQLIQKQALSYLDKVGVKPVEALGKPFDPRFHEAVSQEPAPHTPHHQVIRESQRGYLFRERLLRPARVVVANNPGSPESEPPMAPPENVTPIKC